MAGFKDVIGSWKTMENNFPRSLCISRSRQSVMFTPHAHMLPDRILAEAGRSLITALHRALFPHPDSPTTARTSPDCSVKLTSRTACTSPCGVSKLTDRFFTSNT